MNVTIIICIVHPVIYFKFYIHAPGQLKEYNYLELFSNTVPIAVIAGAGGGAVVVIALLSILICIVCM